MKNLHIGPLLLALAAPFTSVSLAQTPPDAGQLLRQQPNLPAITPSKPIDISPTLPTDTDKDSGPRILIKGFNIVGAVLISKNELQQYLQAAVGQSLSLPQLQALANLLVAHYADSGYIARIMLPPQDIEDGIVTIKIIEGQRGSLLIESKDSKLDTARIERFINRRIRPGDPMSLFKLNEALAILNEQPGVSVRTTLKPSQQEGEVDLQVHAESTPKVIYLLGANNYGTKETGEWQTSASVTLNNPSGQFDSLSLLANTADGIRFGRLDYSVALGTQGLRAGIFASRLDYKVTQGSLSDSHIEGTAASQGITLNYPLIVQNDFSLRLDYRLEDKTLMDQTAMVETGNRNVKSHSFGFSGHAVSKPGRFFGGSVTSFSATLVTGEANQDNDTARAQDIITRQSASQFSKITYQLSHLLPLANTWSLNSSLRGQFADKNLDSSERMSLGGPNGVRAYPVADATGDEGQIFSVSFDKALKDKLTARLFVDAGTITVNHSTWDGWNSADPTLKNSYHLIGAGISLDWRISAEALLTCSIATPIGNHPGSNAQDKNSDGSTIGPRGWLNLIVRF